MKILRIMGCQSIQYGSIERYLVLFAQKAHTKGHAVCVAYDTVPCDACFKADLQAAGAELISLGLNKIFDWKFIFRLQDAIKAGEFKIVHAYFSPSCHFAMLACWAMGIRGRLRTATNMPLLTHTVHRTITPWFRLQFGWRQRMYSWFPRKIIMRSEAMRDEFLSLGVSANKLALIQGSVDTEYFTPGNMGGRLKIRREFGLEDDCYLIGTLVRLVPMKGLETLLQGMAEFKLSSPSARLFIAGDGPLRAQLEALALKLGISDRVIFAGHRQDNRDILAALDVFVLPSLSEGASNALAEAMACGLPVIASDIGPNASLVVHGHSGLLVPVNAPVALASALAEHWGSREEASRLGKAARERVVEMFGIEKRIDNELALYEELLVP